jgi:hypothetical protein
MLLCKGNFDLNENQTLLNSDHNKHNFFQKKPYDCYRIGLLFAYVILSVKSAIRHSK